jgi:hypothetical protein
MDVEMRDGLATVPALIDHKSKAVAQALAGRDLGCDDEEVAKQFRLGGGSLADAGNDLARDYEDMGGRLGSDIVEGHAMLVFMDDPGRNLTVGDALEEGLGHRFSEHNDGDATAAGEATGKALEGHDRGIIGGLASDAAEAARSKELVL